MGEILELREHRFKSLNHAIRDLYLKMALQGLGNRRDPMAKLSDEEVVERVLFYRKMCGEFAKRFRSARYLTPYNLSELLGWSENKYVAFELGCIAFSDEEFLSICRYLGAEKEVHVFMENLEEVFNKGLHNPHAENKEILESLGIKFCEAKSSIAASAESVLDKKYSTDQD